MQFIVAIFTVWYATDNHRTTTIQVQRYDDDEFARKVTQAIDKSQTIKRIDLNTKGIDGRVLALEQWKKDLLDPNMRKLRIDQESLNRGQDEIRRKLETNEAFIKLSDPNRVVGLIRAELAFARESGRSLPPSQIVDYKAAIKGIPHLLTTTGRPSL